MFLTFLSKNFFNLSKISLILMLYGTSIDTSIDTIDTGSDTIDTFHKSSDTYRYKIFSIL